jgi:inner membrane protein YidH
VAEAAQVELKESAREVEKSAGTLAHSTGQIKDSAERRTELAADRNVFAAERTYAAWVRTGLAALASGVGAKAAPKDVIPEYIVVAAGTVLALFSAFCFFAGIWREFFSAGPPPPQPDIKVLPRLVLIGVNSFLILVALAAVFGIWFGRTGGR